MMMGRTGFAVNAGIGVGIHTGAAARGEHGEYGDESQGKEAFHGSQKALRLMDEQVSKPRLVDADGSADAGSYAGVNDTAVIVAIAVTTVSITISGGVVADGAAVVVVTAAAMVVIPVAAVGGVMARVGRTAAIRIARTRVLDIGGAAGQTKTHQGQAENKEDSVHSFQR